ncbi:MAG: fibronectin type III domain-containing protein [Clostridia bacterium]|nr:fibronectin type III domain-containing protein [Clostridia bacterium]
MKAKNTKILSLILTMVLLSVCFALSASALVLEYDENGDVVFEGETITTAEYKYTVVDIANKYILLEKINNYNLDENGTYVTPETIDGYTVKYIEESCFSNYLATNAIRKLVISEGVNEIIDVYDVDYEYGSGTLKSMKKLEEIVFPSTFIKIDNAFCQGCTNLNKVTLGDNIKSIGDDAFRHCISLKSIVLPKNLETLGKRVFSHCDNIETIRIDSNNKNFVTKNNVLFRLNEKGTRVSLIFYAPQKETTKYKINMPVETIESEAFTSAENLKNLTIGKQVTSIEEYAFMNCQNLEKIKTYSDSKLKTIGEGAFDHCFNLKSIKIPEKVKFLGNNTFNYCNEKIKITIRNPELVIGCDIPGRATLVGYKNSTAEKYVEKYGKAEIGYDEKNDIKFKSLGTGEKVYNIEIKDRGRTYLSLTWQKISGADKYQIYVSTNGTKWKKAGESKTNKFKLSDRKASTWYYIKVRAIKDGEKCKFSSVYKTSTKPKTPQNVKAKLTKNGNVKVSWDKLSKVAGYKIYYSTDKNFKKNVKFVYATGGNPDSFIFKNLKKGKTYYFRLTAYKVKETVHHEQEYIESSFGKTVSIKVK